MSFFKKFMKKDKPEPEAEEKSKVESNQPYDEAVDVVDDEEVPSEASPREPAARQLQGRSRGDTPPEHRMSQMDDSDDDFGGDAAAGGGGQMQQQQPPARPGDPAEFSGQDYDEAHEDEDAADDDDDDLSDDTPQGGQQPPAALGGVGPPGPLEQQAQQPRPAKTYGDEDTDEDDSEEDDDDDDEGNVVEGGKKKKKKPPQTENPVASGGPSRELQALEKVPPGGMKMDANNKMNALNQRSPGVSPNPGGGGMGRGRGGGGPGSIGAPMQPQQGGRPGPVPVDQQDLDPSGGPPALATILGGTVNEHAGPPPVNTGGEIILRAYDPADYDHLSVTPEIKELFQYITRYTPQNVELDYHFKPFIPDYIPSIGDVDAFLKIPRPDDKPDSLGLTVLDEPCARQSDPTVLDLQLRAVSKQTNMKQMDIKSIPQSDKNPKAIDNWIKSITEIHKTRPPPNVHYTKNMPDIDRLMQEWPAEFEELLKDVSLPTADLDCDLSTYVDIICGLLDIPVYKSKVQSLHVLFTLFSEFKNSQHFRSLASDNAMDNRGGGAAGGGGLEHGAAADSEDRLVL